MLANTNLNLWVGFVIMGTLLSGPAFLVLLYLIAHVIAWLFPAVNEEQLVGIPLETLGEIST